MNIGNRICYMNTQLIFPYPLLLAALSILPDKRFTAAENLPPSTPEYMVIDLGTLGGVGSGAYGINDHGQVVGDSGTSNGEGRAFLYSNGAMQDLGTLRNGGSGALGINNYGEVVGFIDVRPEYYTFVYKNGVLKELETSRDTYFLARDINDSGQLVGTSTKKGDKDYAALYDHGTIKILGTLGGGGSVVFAINNRGQIVGNSWLPNYTSSHAFLYENSSMRDLGTLWGFSSARDINDHGQVVGYSWINDQTYHAFLYENGSMRDLGTLGGKRSVANSINNKGQVVGFAEVSGNIFVKRAFLYENGVMKDLSTLILQGSGLFLIEATAINNVGQIVGGSTNLKGEPRAFLLNPLPKGWKKAIAETVPAKPTYGECPERQDGKDSLVVVTHGWQPAWKPVDISWVEEMTNRIVRYLESSGKNNWQVHAHRWVEKAQVPLPDTALDSGKKEGKNLGGCLAAKGWTHIHLIAHSAGSALIQAASEALKAEKEVATVHLTFLDPFVGFLYGGRIKYGKDADWADSYFSRDTDTVLTDKILPHAYNVDITWLDSIKKPIQVVYSTREGEVSQTCYQTISSHEWPHKFYADTIDPNSVLGSEGFGFPLSRELDDWDTLKSRYPVGNSVPRVLGSGELLCLEPERKLTVSVISRPNLTTAQLIKSETGNVIIHGIDYFSLRTASPVWLAMPTVITSAVNFVSFEAQFTSASGAEGLLSVFWNTNTIGSSDEKVTPTGSKMYSFQLPYAVTNGVGMVGFRLDAFSATQSSVIITNITLGFAGIRGPFSLSPAGTTAEGMSKLELRGPAGFTYAVESSTNLTNWEVTALLVNTNGMVRFTVPKETMTARFYRAVVP